MSSKDNTAKITVYSTQWCPDCTRARQVLKDSKVDFDEIDVSKDKEAAEIVKALNNGNRSVPTIVFPDGSFLTEPSGQVLKDKLEQLSN